MKQVVRRTSTLGVRAASAFQLDDGIGAVARGSRGWRHASGDTRPLSTHSLASGDAFIIAGAPIGRDAAPIEAGLDLSNAHDATLSLSYSGQIASHAQDHGFALGLSIRSERKTKKLQMKQHGPGWSQETIPTRPTCCLSTAPGSALERHVTRSSHRSWHSERRSGLRTGGLLQSPAVLFSLHLIADRQGQFEFVACHLRRWFRQRRGPIQNRDCGVIQYLRSRAVRQ